MYAPQSGGAIAIGPMRCPYQEANAVFLLHPQTCHGHGVALLDEVAPIVADV